MLAAEVRNDQVEPEQHGDAAQPEAGIGEVLDPGRRGNLAVAGDGGEPDAEGVEDHDGHGGNQRGAGYGEEFQPLHRCGPFGLLFLARWAARALARAFFLAKRTACPASSTSTALWWPTWDLRETRNIYSTAPMPATAAITTPTMPVLTSSAVRAPTMPAAGSVKSQPRAMRPTMPQRTVVPRRPMPEPMTEPEATWVVDSAKPRCEEARMADAVDDSAAKPWAGLTSVSPRPMVRMIRQPPE